MFVQNNHLVHYLSYQLWMKSQFSDRIIPSEWSGHFDMLHDVKRNAAYANGIQTSIRLSLENQCDRELLVCDIGCGSGLLACLAARCNKNIKVVAFETVEELARIAKETVVRNGLCEQIFVWHMHTTTIDEDFMLSRFGRRADAIGAF